jgi:ParB-like nuclease domain
MKRVKPDTFLRRVEPRHPADEKLVELLTADMRKRGWRGRPILVTEIGTGRNKHYETVTGVHRSTAAMTLGIPIPVVVIKGRELSEGQWEQVRWSGDYDYLCAVFEDAGLKKAVELIYQEHELGGFYRESDHDLRRQRWSRYSSWRTSRRRSSRRRGIGVSGNMKKFLKWE